MKNEMNRASIPLKTIATIIALVTILYWVLDGLLGRGWSLMRYGDSLQIIVFHIILWTITGVGIAATIAIWAKPLIGGVGFLLIGFSLVCGYSIEPERWFNFLLFATVFIVCGFLSLIIGRKNGDNIDVKRVAKIIKVIAIIFAVGLILYWVIRNFDWASYIRNIYVYRAIWLFIILGFIATIATWTKPLIGGIAFILLAFCWMVIVLSGLFPKFSNWYAQDTVSIPIGCIVCGALSLTSWWMGKELNDVTISLDE